jgi:cell wall-associated NlpC family hydrolase
MNADRETTIPARPEAIAPAPGERHARLAGPSLPLDPRSHVARDGVVEIALADSVAAARYVEPAAMRCRVPRVPMRNRGDAGTTAVSELLWGEAFDLFDIAGDWALGRSVADRYTGWVPAAALDSDVAAPAGPRVTARSAPLFALADIKAPVLADLPFGARLSGVAGDRFFAVAGGGFVHNRHLGIGMAQPGALPEALLDAARHFTGAPYVWGGRTPLGVDCSGLVQAALAACGISAPRDTDQQLAAIGIGVSFDDRLAGDLVYFPGHVGILASGDRLFHANAHWMTTVEEPLDDVIGRLSAAGVDAPVTGVRRPTFQMISAA